MQKEAAVSLFANRSARWEGREVGGEREREKGEKEKFLAARWIEIIVLSAFLLSFSSLLLTPADRAFGFLIYLPVGGHKWGEKRGINWEIDKK